MYKIIVFWLKFIEICSEGLKSQKKDDNLVLNRQQTIIWIDDSLARWCINSSKYVLKGPVNKPVKGDNLLLNRQQAIIWTDDSLGLWCVNASRPQ